MDSLPEVEEVVARIYEAAVLPGDWPDVLEMLGRFVGAWGGALLAVEAQQQLQYVATENYAPLYQEFARSTSRFRNIRAERFLAGRHSEFLRDVDLCTPEELEADPLYNRFLRPAGLGWTTGTAILVPNSDLLVVDFVRQQGDGPFDAATNRLLDRFRPHLARAAMVSARLGLQRATAAVQALETVGLPAAVLRSTGRVMAANSLLDTMLPRITVAAKDRLAIADAAADALLRAAIEALRVGARPSTLSIPVPVQDMSPALIVHLLPLERAASDIFFGGAAMAVVTPVTAPSAPLTELLNGLFDLTPAEARLARALSSGMTTGAFAEANRLSRETIKKQLHSVFAKTATRRQAELVRLLAAVSPLRNAGPSPTVKDA